MAVLPECVTALGHPHQTSLRSCQITHLFLGGTHSADYEYRIHHCWPIRTDLRICPAGPKVAQPERKVPEHATVRCSHVACTYCSGRLRSSGLPDKLNQIRQPGRFRHFSDGRFLSRAAPSRSIIERIFLRRHLSVFRRRSTEPRFRCASLSPRSGRGMALILQRRVAVSGQADLR